MSRYPTIVLTTIALALSLLACDTADLTALAQSTTPEPEHVEPQAPAAPTLHQGWHFPSQDTHDETLRLQRAAQPLRVVRGTARYEGLGGRCPASMEFSDLVVGVAEQGTDAGIVLLRFSVTTAGTYQAFADSRAAREILVQGRSLTMERGLQGSDHEQLLRYTVSDCGVLEITTNYVSPVAPIDHRAWVDYAYSRTLLATDTQLYDRRHLGLSFLSLVPTAAPPMSEEQEAAIQAGRATGRTLPHSGCIGAGLLPAQHYEYLSACADVGYVGCYLQLRQVDMNGLHYDGVSNDTLHFSPSLWEDLPEDHFDLAQFLRGISLNFHVSGQVDSPLLHSNLPRFSRQSPDLRQELIRRVQDPHLDEFNRVSALLGLLHSSNEDLTLALWDGDLSTLSEELLLEALE